MRDRLWALSKLRRSGGWVQRCRQDDLRRGRGGAGLSIQAQAVVDTRRPEDVKAVIFCGEPAR